MLNNNIMIIVVTTDRLKCKRLIIQKHSVALIFKEITLNSKTSNVM